MVKVPIPDFAPDSSLLDTNTTSYVRNVYPDLNGYVAVKQFAAMAEPLSDKPLGIISINRNGRDIYLAGTSKDLWALYGAETQWRKVSKPGASYQASEDNPWTFTIFGDLVIAVTKNDPPQAYDISKEGNFRDLGGSPPKAEAVTTWGDFVVLIAEEGHPNRVRWSGLNDAEHWQPGSKSSDFQDFAEGGKVVGTSANQDPIIFMENAIYRGQFLPSSALIYAFQLVGTDIGAISNASIVTTKAGTFFIHRDGFYVIDRTGQYQNIGFGKVDKFLVESVTPFKSKTTIGVNDRVTTRVMWAINTDARFTHFNLILVYDYNLKRWSIIEKDITIFGAYYSQGYTLEELDTISDDLDALPFSLDSPIWDNNRVYIAAFDKDFALGSFSGQNMEAVIETSEVSSGSNQAIEVRDIALYVNAPIYAITVGKRSALNLQPQWLPERTPSKQTGSLLGVVRGKYIKVRFRIPEGVTWNYISAWQFNMKVVGRR